MSLPKRRKLEQDKDEAQLYPVSLTSEIEAELGLEIALRKRLLDTLEARIAWAVALKEVLNKSEGNATPDTFRSVALDTLQLIEAQSDIILCHDPRPPFSSKIAKPPPRKGIPFSHVKTKPSFLFIRSSTLPGWEVANRGQDNHLYLLKCPHCSKTSFTSLQGLLNHARLVHHLEWGSHEECITACAIPDNDLDVTNGTEVGIGPTGILPGLRNIFQMAVGTRNSENERALVLPDSNSSTTTALPATTSLNVTLGLHDETAALAIFLGKEPVRRQIKVSEEDEVDIEGMTSASPYRVSPSRRWRMPFAQRHDNGLCHSGYEFQKDGSPTSMALDSSTYDNPSSLPIIQTVSAQSRFHVVSRITITDRSLWIPPENRLPEYKAYTHKWMISIDSPSYTYHITSILNSVQVTVSDSNINNNNAHIQVPLIPAVAKSSPPFVVIGLASAPFLGKVTLAFAGPHFTSTPPDSRELSGSEQVFVFGHWIDLYPFPVSHIVKGQDQVVDIDLDKDTAIRAPDRNYTPIDARSLWMQPFESIPSHEVLPLTEPVNALDHYEEKLLELSKRFPMTLEGFKGKRSKPPNVPYIVASSVRHYLSFVTGRRKAIEWGRARAIHDAYHEAFDSIPLSVADIYSWLSENGHFPRPVSDLTKAQLDHSCPDDQDEVTQSTIYCRFCGLDTQVHDRITQFKQEDSEENIHNMSKIFEEIESKTPKKMFPRPTGQACLIAAPELQITKFPRIDTKQFILPDQRAPDYTPSPTNLHTSALLGIAEPSIAVHIHDLTKRWDLRTFHNPSRVSGDPVGSPRATGVMMPLEAIGKSRKEVETKLAPHALLALLAERFIRAVVHRGLEVANRDKSTALGSRRRGKNQLNPLLATRMLTPTHILSGILTRGVGTERKRHPLDAALLLSLSKLGVVVENAERDAMHAASRQDKPPLEIKMEE